MVKPYQPPRNRKRKERVRKRGEKEKGIREGGGEGKRRTTILALFLPL